jgi:putative hemolysin
MLVELSIILFLILANGLFAMAEFAVVSARKPRLQYLAQRGNLGAQAALELANAPSNFLSTIQIGITLIGILAGAFGGAGVADRLDDQLVYLPLVGDYAEAISFVIVITAITYLSLVLGELVPKRLALIHPEAIASTLAQPMRLLSRLTSPIVQLISFSTELVLTVLGAHRSTQPAVTEEELRTLISTSHESGVIHQREAELLLRVLRAGDRLAREIMVPRTETVWTDQKMTISEFLEFNALHYYDHFPVCDGNLDKVVGVLSVKEALRASTHGEFQPSDHVERLAQPAYFVPETKRGLELLYEMIQRGEDVALAIDEYGGTAGLITFEHLVGEVVGRVRPEEGEEFQIIDEDTIQVAGTMRIDDANERLELGLPEGEYETVAGFIINRLERFPDEGDSVDYNSLQLVVSKSRGPRVEQVMVIRRRGSCKSLR